MSDLIKFERIFTLSCAFNPLTPIHDFAPLTADLGSCALSTSRPNVSCAWSARMSQRARTVSGPTIGLRQPGD
ncbi:hypothetical protein PI124_g11390 [Phytophthora idaei]|nr:hypothetical protein PI124_g11390 [Phytophthora idaei]